MGSIYTYAMWNAAGNQWEHTTTVSSWKEHEKFLKIFQRSRPKATVSDVYGCIRLPLLKVQDRYFALLNFCGQANHDLRAPLRQEGGTGRAC